METTLLQLTPDQKKAIAQIATSNFTEAQSAVLLQRTPQNVIRQREGRGGKIFNYVPHAWVTRVLNNAFGWRWNFEILETRFFPNDSEPIEVVVKGRLTVETDRGFIIKEQFGGHDVAKLKSGQGYVSIADDMKKAGTDALKKCASLLGIALDLYENK